MRKKIIYASIVAFLIAAGLGYHFTFNAKHRNIAQEEAKIILQATELQSPFADGDQELTASYIDQVVQVTGKVTDISSKTIELDYTVEANLIDSLATEFQDGAIITIKGRCVGYDDLLEMVRVDQATLIENK